MRDFVKEIILILIFALAFAWIFNPVYVEYRVSDGINTVKSALPLENNAENLCPSEEKFINDFNENSEINRNTFNGEISSISYETEMENYNGNDVISITSICPKGAEEGENIDYRYCSSSFIPVVELSYERVENNEIVESGDIVYEEIVIDQDGNAVEATCKPKEEG